jgi:hypothetical protein
MGTETKEADFAFGLLLFGPGFFVLRQFASACQPDVEMPLPDCLKLRAL